MQTIPGSTNRQRAKTLRPRRDDRRNVAEPVLAAGFAILYMWLAYSMEALNFDTVFIALFCTMLSVFVIRCFRAWMTGR